MDDQGSRGGFREVGEGFKTILERIADFFDIFDLSFIVSGATCLAAIGFFAWRAGLESPPFPTTWVGGAGLVLAAYVLGLMSFALGRWLRTSLRRRRSEEKFHRRFVQVLGGHGLLQDSSQVSKYLSRAGHRGDWRLYIRMWAELRSAPQLKASFYLLRRYWVMAATYDGLAIALTVWVAVLSMCMFSLGADHSIDPALGVPIVAVMALAVLACLREASRYVDYQVEELVAAVVAAGIHPEMVE